MRTDIQPGLLRQMTSRRILDVLRRGPASRADLVRQTGISAPTVSKAVGLLIDGGLLEEAELAPTQGRPGRRLRLPREATQVIGVELDRGRSRLVAAGLDGAFVESAAESIEVPDRYDLMLDAIVDRVAALVARPGVKVLGLGVSTPGLIDRAEGTVLLSPNLPWTNGRSLGPDLSQRLGLDVHLIQEANALCLAERAYGRAANEPNFALLDATTGLGLGIVQDDELILGHRGLAGELGHITMDPEGPLCGCGNRGCLETFATDSRILADLEAIAGRDLTLEEALAISTSSDEYRAILDRSATYFSIALAAVVNLFDPAAVFVRSRWVADAPGFYEDVIDRARSRALGPSFDQTRIELAAGSKVQGAVAGVLERVLDSIGPPS